MAGICPFFFAGSTGPKSPSYIIAGLFLTTIPVALFEEYAFRGPLLTDLSRRFSAPMGVLLSSVVFTVFHFQAQPLTFWGAIFLMGVILANLRLRGLSLGWLAATHFLVDTECNFFGSWQPTMSSLHGIAYQAALFLYAFASFPYKKRNHEH